MERKLRWCFKIKDGAKLLRPSKIISDSYLSLAKDSLKRAEIMLDEGDLLWTTVMIYYAEYYALYSFLARIGIKCENHFCSILITKILLGKEKVRTIEKDKEKRTDAQYYLRVSEEREIRSMLNSAKILVAEFEEIVSNLDEREIILFRNKIKKLLR
jgi:uncharacterized protein (UPF0332 family)